MAQVNKYDWANVGAIVDNLNDRVSSIIKQDKELRNRIETTEIAAKTNRYTSTLRAVTDKEIAAMQTKQSGLNVRSTNQTNLDIAKLKARIDREVADLKANTDIYLKNLGITGEAILEQFKHLNAKERIQYQEAMDEALSRLNQSQSLERIQKEFENQMTLNNNDYKAALFRTVVAELGKIYTGLPGKSAINAVAYTATVEALARAFGYSAINDLYSDNPESDKGNEDVKLLPEGGSKDYTPPRSKYPILHKGDVNYEENKPGWETRPTEKERKAFKTWKEIQGAGTSTFFGSGTSR